MQTHSKHELAIDQISEAKTIIDKVYNTGHDEADKTLDKVSIMINKAIRLLEKDQHNVSTNTNSR